MDDKKSLTPNPRDYCIRLEKFLKRYPNGRFNFHQLKKSLGYEKISFYYWLGIVMHHFSEKHIRTQHSQGRVFFEYRDGEVVMFYSLKWQKRRHEAPPLETNKPAATDNAGRIQGWKMRYEGYEELKRAWHEKIQFEKRGFRLNPLGSFDKDARKKIVDFFREQVIIEPRPMLTDDDLERVTKSVVQVADALNTYADNVLLIIKSAGLIPHRFDYATIESFLRETGQLEGTFVADKLQDKKCEDDGH